ncbi:MAG: NAD(+) kinase [Pasteurella sp.]|nr:NAD(+) kinase [Pasteurella sp.]
MEKERNFQHIAIVGQPRRNAALETHLAVYNWLKDRGYQISIEENVAKQLNLSKVALSLDEIGKQAHLVIVIGGDGNMLGVARELAKYEVPLLGINRGSFGFLTDIAPQTAFEQLYSCLECDEFIIEERFLLEAHIERNGKIIKSNNALNEVVINPAQIVKTMEFEVCIDGKFAFSQRSDGMIISTPTGSTAYSLSVGGPILTPNMDAMALVPMYPHTLSARPLVIDGDSEISLRFSENNLDELQVSCDSQVYMPFSRDDRIIVRKSNDRLHLLHLDDYNYFSVLGSKLGWLNKLF